MPFNTWNLLLEKPAKFGSVGINVSKGFTIKDLCSKETFDFTPDAEISTEVPPHVVVVVVVQNIKGEPLPFNVFQYGD